MSWTITSAPEAPSQWYCEKNGDLSRLTGSLCADSKEIMPSNLINAIACRRLWNALGCSWITDSLEGCQMASVIPLSAVGT